MRFRFVFNEIVIGLRRNLTMTIAMVITVAIALVLFGSSLIMRAQVSTMKDYWYDKVEVSIFLCGKNSGGPTGTPSCSAGAVTNAQRAQIYADLNALKPTYVQTIYHETPQQAYEHFRQYLKGSPLLDNVTPDMLPESFRVKLTNPNQVAVVATEFLGRPGVQDVRDQRQALAKLFRALSALQLVALTIAIAMIVVTVLLVVNTMRVAAFSRRRETGIMRLVGASNFYIQLPFLLEAALAAAAGAVFASLALIVVKSVIIDHWLASTFTFTAFIGWPVVLTIIPIVVAIGIALAVIAAFFTLRKYLRV